MKTIRWFFLLIFCGVGLAMLLMALFTATLPKNAGDMTMIKKTMAFQGVLFTAIGVLLYILLGLGEKKRESLLTDGTRVQGEIVAVERNMMIRMNRRCPWRVKVRCVHPLTGEEITLRSHSLWDCAYQPGEKVDVLFDPVNEKKYAVDVQEAEA